MKKMKVIHLITGLHTGGAEMMVYKTATNMDKDKFIPIVISLLPIGKVGEMLKKEKIMVYSLNLKSSIHFIQAFVSLMKIIRHERPDILHCYMFHADILGRIAGTLSRVPVIISSIRNENIGGKAREKILALTDFMVDKVTAVCRAAGETQVKRGSIKESKLKVVYNGIEADKFTKLTEKERSEIRAAFSIPEHHHVLITVGRLETQKNHELLLKSFARTRQEQDNCTLLIVGDGHLRQSLEAMTRDYHLSDYVIFTGIRDDIPQLLAASDLFVLASSWEGMPNVVLEAMAARLPVVATKVGGTGEVVVDGKSGYLVQPNQENELSEAILKALSLSNEERVAMGVAGRTLVETNFTIQRTLEVTEQLYVELLNHAKK